MQDWEIEREAKRILDKGGLTQQEFEDLFAQYEKDKADGISPKDSWARTLLILCNEKLVGFVIVDKLKRGCCDLSSDEYSIGKNGLIKAVDKFDPNKNMRFSSFATKVIINEIRLYYRQQNTLKRSTEHVISLEYYLKESEENGYTARLKCLIDETDFREDVKNADLYNQVIGLMVHLTPQEQYIIVASFGLYGNSIINQEKIAVQLGYTRQVVGKRLAKALKKLRILLTSEDFLDENDIVVRRELMSNSYPKVRGFKQALEDSQNNGNA